MLNSSITDSGRRLRIRPYEPPSCAFGCRGLCVDSKVDTIKHSNEIQSKVVYIDYFSFDFQFNKVFTSKVHNKLDEFLVRQF